MSKNWIQQMVFLFVVRLSHCPSKIRRKKKALGFFQQLSEIRLQIWELALGVQDGSFGQQARYN